MKKILLGFIMVGVLLNAGCTKSFMPAGSYKVTVYSPHGTVVYRGIDEVRPTDAGGWKLYDTKANKIIYVSKRMDVVIEQE